MGVIVVVVDFVVVVGVGLVVDFVVVAGVDLVVVVDPNQSN